jgi:hypothetical protein
MLTPNVLIYIREIAEVSAILAHNLMDRINEITDRNIQDMDRVELVAKAAIEFVNSHPNITEWSEFVNSQTQYPQATDWEDYAVMWATDKIKELYNA